MYSQMRFSKEFIDEVINGGLPALKAKALTLSLEVKGVSARFGEARIAVQLRDKDTNGVLIELADVCLAEGSTLEVTDIQNAFNITLG